MPGRGPVGARRSSAEALGLLARLADAPGQLLRLDRGQTEALAASDEPKLRGQGRLAQRLGGEEVVLAALRHGDVLVGVLVGGRAADRFTATRMAELRTFVRALAADTPDTPAATLARLDAVLVRLAPDLSGTCLYARLDLRRGTLRWSSAGHLPPVLLRSGRAVCSRRRPSSCSASRR